MNLYNTIIEMNKMLKIFLLCFLLCSSLPLYSYNSKFGISINYPGIGLKYIYYTNIFELKFQYLTQEEYNTTLFGLKYYKISNLIKNTGLFYYFGGEGAYFKHSERYLSNDFNTANGWLFGLYLGFEKFFSKKFSVNFDFGPYVAMATISDYSSSGFDFVLNTSVNYYLEK